MNQDEQNLNLLSIFHYVVGTLTILGSSLFLIHVGLGIAALTGNLDPDDGSPRTFGLLFTIIGSLAVTIGWTLGILIIVAGRKLKARTSRTFCLVIAGIECMITPFGTVLGIFTIITLMKDSVIQLFAANQPPAIN